MSDAAGSAQQVSDLQPPAALAGIRVLEIADGHYAWCGKLLADMGAEVIKIEPLGGEPARGYPPFWGDRPDERESLAFLYLNTGKQSIALDLGTPEGVSELQALARVSDVLIETLPPGRMAELGLSCETLRAANPGLVYTSITGFGQTGPHRDYLATDLVTAAMSGAMAVIGYPEDPPVALAGEQATIMASTMAACGSLMACYHSRLTGVGQHVDISAQEAMLAVSSICGVGKWLEDDIIPHRYGASLFAAVPSGTYACRDGSIYLIINRPRHWQVLASWVHQVTGNREILDPMFEGPSSARQPYRELLDLFIGELTAQFSVEAFYREGQQRHLAVTPLNMARDIAGDAHLRARKFYVEMAHRGGRKLSCPGPPYRLSATPWRMHGSAPALDAGRDRVDAMLKREAGSVAGSPEVESSPVCSAGGALAGLRVVEFSAGMAGPWIGRYMAWSGADVIKVESADYPDVTRLYVAPKNPERGIQSQLSPWFTDWNAGKRFVALDLTKPRGLALARRLIATCDVVIDNNGNGVLEKLGLGFEALKQIKPGLILFSSTGYGKVGPDAAYISWGPNIETLSGLSGLSGFPHRSCTMTQFAYPDPLSALHGLFAILCALEYRRKTGCGQIINLSQLEATVAAMGHLLLEVFANDREPLKVGNASRVWAPQGVYACRGEDRWCAISVVDQGQWRRFCEQLQQPGLRVDARFVDNASRLQHRQELDEIITNWSRTREPWAVMKQLQAVGIPAGVVQNVEDQYVRDEHLAQRHFFEHILHRVKGSVIATGIPLGLTGTPGKTSDSGRPVGSDNRAVFCELLGLGEVEFRALVTARVIQGQDAALD